MPFDFYFPFADRWFLIEYQGRQHYEAVSAFGGEESLCITQSTDLIKSKWCKDNGYHLIIISYKDYEKIGSIIVDTLANITGVNPLEYKRAVTEHMLTETEMVSVKNNSSLNYGIGFSQLSIFGEGE